jgi:hypothetical protein
VIHGPDTAGGVPGEFFEDHSVVVSIGLPIIEPQVGQLAGGYVREGDTQCGNSDARSRVAQEFGDGETFLEGGLFARAAA